jgi:hypothetical protein
MHWTVYWMSPTAGLDALGETNLKSQRGIEPRLYCTVLYSGLQHRHRTNWAIQDFSCDKRNSCPCACACRDSIWGNLSTAPLIRNSLTLRTLTAGEKSPGIHWVRSWVGPHLVWTYWRKEKFPAPASIRIRIIQTLNQLSCSKFHTTVQNQPRPLAECQHNTQNGTDLPRKSNYLTIYGRNMRLFGPLLA